MYDEHQSSRNTLDRYSLTARTFVQLTLNQLFVLFYNALLCAY